MKKIHITFIALMLFASLTQAQSNFHFGLKAAPSLAWLHSNSKDFTSNGSKVGFNYGLITEFNFGGHYAFATGLDASYRGGKSRTTSSDTSGATIITDATYNLEYIELPLTLKFKTSEIGSITYFLQVGVSPGINIRARGSYTTTLPGGTTLEGSDIDIKDQVASMNMNMIVGGGLEFSLAGNTALLVGVTFNNGFLDILKDSNIKANSNYLALTIGFLF